MRHLGIFLFLCFAATVGPLPSGAQALDSVGSRADRIENKRFSKKLWSRPEESSLQNKRFPIKQWDKHFSPIGGQRAPISMGETREKKLFESKVLPRKEVPLELSRWNQTMAELHQRAGIQMDDRSRLAGDHKLYRRMMQEARFYKDTGEVLSLKDINRYQFRRNRPDGEIPSKAAGSGQ